MNEDEAPAAARADSSDGLERLEVDERIRADTRADEARAVAGPAASATNRPLASATTVAMPSSHAAHELAALGGGKSVVAERALQREDGDIGALAVEEGETRFEVVLGRVEREAPFGDLELGADDPGG